MERRDFLKLCGASLGSMLVIPTVFGQVAALAVETQSGNVRYRGAHNGEIHASRDEGQTWQLHTRLAPQCSILSLFSDDDGQVYAQVGYMGYMFHLSLSENRTHWKTV